MTTFSRGLAPEAYAVLAGMAASDSGNWWIDLLSLWSPSGIGDEARPLRLAVRNGYLNFYLRGQSVARVDFNRRAGAFAEVHVKYAFADRGGGNYARLSGVTVTAKGAWGSRAAEYAGLATLTEWMGRARTWETPEKALVERLTAANPNIIDLEMGLPAHAGRAKPLRIDVVALEATPEGASVVLWEAKRVTDSRLRSRSEMPHVQTHQITPYRTYLSDPEHRAAVIAAYRETCRTLTWLAAMTGPSCLAGLDPLVRKVASGEVCLTLDGSPRLVIFGTEPELVRSGWPAHHAKLARLGVPMAVFKPADSRLPCAAEMTGA